jgi:hypothetical protein
MMILQRRAYGLKSKSESPLEGSMNPPEGTNTGYQHDIVFRRSITSVAFNDKRRGQARIIAHDFGVVR